MSKIPAQIHHPFILSTTLLCLIVGASDGAILGMAPVAS
jgi:hypothetical protein